MNYSKKRLGKIPEKKSKRRYGGDFVSNPFNDNIIQEKLIAYLNSIASQSKRIKDNEVTSIKKCFQPSSKGGQEIYICDKKVYKTPKEGIHPHITVKGSTIYVDGFTMNVFIQSLVKSDSELNKVVECYNDLRDGLQSKTTDFFRTLEGPAYSYITGRKKTKDGVDKEDPSFAVENFIDYLNHPDFPEEKQTMAIIQLSNWIETMIKTLNLLWDKLQFHHCDPKAAQLFINGNFINDEGKLGESQLHRPKRKMRQNIFMICIFYNYVSGNLLDVPLLFSSLKYLKLPYKYLRKYLDFLF